ncbi:disease resistance protein RPS4B-like [Tripterygium wilfordii]|uniref:disease resistance protein RPS4B-like n=1 Tax=Tripterygium wilfordii TaxID=458696 RepID=UPI0018F80894|nr:disease resistance protein RPS4B-like [Tripterygium wilfordii]
MVASPLSTTARRVFDSRPDCLPVEFQFQFLNCWKLDRNARNSIVADLEWKLLHLKANYPGSENFISSGINFPGGDVPDWFNYKSWGSSLASKLPTHWFNDEFVCLVFSIVLECKDFPKYIDCGLNSNCHIRTNRGDSFNVYHGLEFCPVLRDAIWSNHVILNYDESWINYWRRIPEEADDVDEITIEFGIGEYAGNKDFKIKECGMHLQYTHDIEIDMVVRWSNLTLLVVI